MNTQFLGLKIVKSLNGYQEVAECNADPTWAKNVRDTRNDIKVIEGLQEDCQTSVIMYTADSVGEYYTIVSLIAGRANDFISAWVFRPWGLEIAGKDLATVLLQVKEEILANEINEARLSKLFEKSYPKVEASVTPICTEGSKFAVRYYNDYTKIGGDYTLDEILKKGVAQKVNKGYKTIFLIDSKMGLKADQCDDITPLPLEKSIIINPLSDKQIKDLGQGFKPYINNSLFTAPITAVVGDKVTIIWKREKYQDVEIPLIVKESGLDIRTPLPNEVKRLIMYSDIVVTGDSAITNYTLKINGQPLKYGYELPVSEAALKAKIEVSCEGYADYSGTHDLSEKVTIKLTKKTYKYTFVILDGYGKADFKFDIETRYKLTHTPLEGYHSTNGCLPSTESKNYIEYVPEGFSKKLVYILMPIIFCLGLMFGAICLWQAQIYFKPVSPVNPPQYYGASVSNDSNKGYSNNNSTILSNSNREDQTSSMQKAISYLDNSLVWKKSEMEQYQELKGLWDAMNTFNLDEICSKYGKLIQSSKYMNLVNAISDLNQATNYKPTFGRSTSNMKADDESIVIDDYIRMLKKKKEEALKKSQQQSQGNKKKNLSKGNPKQQESTSGKSLDNGLSNFEDQ